MHDIIETMTEARSEQMQLAVHAARIAKYREEGYAVVRQADGTDWIYPRNAATGETDMDATPTKLWAEPAITPDETYEIPMPADVEPVFAGTDYIIRERPASWPGSEAS